MTEHIVSGDLLDYWLDDVPVARGEAIESHVFECDRCAARLDELRALGEDLVALMRYGQIGSISTTALVNRLSRDKLHVREYTLAAGDIVACTVTPHDDLLLARMALAEPSPERVDVSFRDGDGNELMRIDDVMVDRRLNQVVSVIPAHSVRPSPSGRRQYVLLTPGAGGERVLGTYTLDHTGMSES